MRVMNAWLSMFLPVKIFSETARTPKRDLKNLKGTELATIMFTGLPVLVDVIESLELTGDIWYVLFMPERRQKKECFVKGFL